MKLLLKTIKALADGNRLRIIRLLMDRPRCVCELQVVLGITQPSVSKHLRILEEAGLVDKKRSGQFIDYHLDPPTDPTDQRAALMAHLIPWLQIDSELATSFSTGRILTVKISVVLMEKGRQIWPNLRHYSRIVTL
jgi:ArsR family transcriptional regulator